MNSKDAARLAFGNPGFLDFLGNIGESALQAVNPFYSLTKKTITNIAPATRGTPLEGLITTAQQVGSAAETIAGTIIPSAGITSVFTDLSSTEEDGTGPNEVGDQDDGVDQ